MKEKNIADLHSECSYTLGVMSQQCATAWKSNPERLSRGGRSSNLCPVCGKVRNVAIPDELPINYLGNHRISVV